MDHTSFLRSIDLFRECPAADLAKVAAQLTPRDVPAGRTIFARGDPGVAMYLIQRGRVQILTPDAEGQEQVLVVREAESFFGEMALLGRRPHSATARAVTDVLLLELRREDFEQLVASSPTVLTYLLNLLVERQTAANARVVQPAGVAGALPPCKRGKVVTIYSSKGGAGRTMVAANLAVALAQYYPDRVVLLDLGLTFGHIASTLDLQPHTSLASMEGAAIHEFDAEMLHHYLVRHASTLRVLAGTLRPEDGERVTQQGVQRLLEGLRRCFDFVVVDTDPNFSDVTMEALQSAERVIYLLTPEMTSVRDGSECQRIFSDVLNMPLERIWYVLNHPYAARTLDRRQVEQGLGQRVHCELPYGGDAAMQAVLRGQPVTVSEPGTPIARALDRLARELGGLAAQAAPAVPASSGRGSVLAFLRR
jgi:Flp pilus assembly CpaE family ATPase